MTDIVFLFEVHQPYRLRKDIPLGALRKGLEKGLSVRELHEVFFDNELNRYVLERAAQRCYIPATRILLDNVKRHRSLDGGRSFRFSLSVSGVFLEQAGKWVPEIVELFREAASTESVEFVGQTYYHSLAMFLGDWDELVEEVEMQRGLVKDLLGYEPVSVENTEFIYNNDIACLFESLGYRVVLTEGVDHILGWRSPNYVYRAHGCNVRVLTRNYRLSDDVGYRFSDKRWDQYPLTASKYALWLASTPGDVVFIAMDFETFGEHHPPETGIHEFLRWLPGEILKYQHLGTETPRRAAYKYPARDIYDVPPWATISWADERDVSAWLGNEYQRLAFNLYAELEPYVKALGDQDLLELWRKLGISDHYYYLATKPGSVGEVHAYFSPYKSLALAYKVLLDALNTLAIMVAVRVAENPRRVAARIRLPWDKGFHFYLYEGKPLGVVARSLAELPGLLRNLPAESIAFHLKRGDLAHWVKSMFRWEQLARELEELAQIDLTLDELKRRIIEVFESHVKGA